MSIKCAIPRPHFLEFTLSIYKCIYTTDTDEKIRQLLKMRPELTQWTITDIGLYKTEDSVW
jgi:hypothetical protein